MKDYIIDKQLKPRGIKDPRIFQAFLKVRREDFVPKKMKEFAYRDSPLPIGKGQTISQPFIVAQMAQLLELKKTDVLFEVGSGCGYNAAVLSHLVSQVYSMEIIRWFSFVAKKNIRKAGIKNVRIRYGDGYQGWPQKAPFDKIMLTAATPKIPEPLKYQLKMGGKIIAPIGGQAIQKLRLLEKVDEQKFVMHDSINVRFVPMVGQVES